MTEPVWPELRAPRPSTPDVVEAVAQSKIEQALFGVGEPVGIGRYVLLGHIGSGGFGDVHAAFDTQLGRRVALKLVHDDDGRAQRRMLREAQALARVSHPNVVAVYDAETVTGDDGRVHLYIALEYIEGQTLRGWLTQSHDWRAVVETFIAAGRGLEAVHRAGLVHHDFKPANVLIGDDGRVRVLDFGLARLRTEGGIDDAPGVPRPMGAQDVLGAPNTVGAISGTPPYMAPEQHAGRTTDAAADIFAYAVALFEGLYGVRPFREDSLEVMIADKNEGRIVDAPQGRVPPRIREILRRALSADPAARYPDMGAMLAALEHRPARRWVMSAAILVLAIGGAVGLAQHQERSAIVLREVDDLERKAHDAAARANFLYPPHDAVDEPTAYRYVLALEELGTDEAQVRAHSLREEFAQTLARLGDRYWDLDGGRTFALDYYLEALVFVPEHPHALERAAVSPGRVVALEQQAARGSFSAAQLTATEPLRVLAQADEAERDAAIEALIEQPPTRPAARDDLKRLRRALGSSRGSSGPKAEPRDDPSESVAEPTVDSESPVPTEAEAGTGSTSETGSEPASDSASVASAEREDRARDPAKARAEVTRARSLLDAGDWRGAEQAYHRALDHDDHAVAALAGLSTLHFDRGAYRKARNFARKAVALRPRAPKYRIAAGDAAFKLHAYDEARRHFEAAARLGSQEAKRRLATLADVVGEPAP